MRLSQQNEWIAIGALIVYIVAVPTLPVVRDFLGSAIGKAVGLGLIVYVWKYVNELIAVLLVIALFRAGAIREYLDNPSVVACPPGQVMDTTTHKCKDAPTTASIPSSSSQVVLTAPPPTTPGPPGGTTPGGAAAALSTMSTTGGSSTERFSPKEPSSGIGGAPFSSL